MNLISLVLKTILMNNYINIKKKIRNKTLHIIPTTFQILNQDLFLKTAAEQDLKCF